MDETSHPKRFESCNIEVFTAELPKIHVFRNVRLCWYFPDVSKNRISFMFRVNQSKNNGLLNIDDEEAMIIWNVGNYLPSESASHPRRLESPRALLWEPENVAWGFSAKVSCVFLATYIAHTYTWCGYKINGRNYFPLYCKLGNSERYVVLACAGPSIHGYNFKAMRQTVWQ